MPTNKPTKRMPVKAMKRQDREAKQLTELAERHPFRIGDPLPPDDVLLGLVQAKISRKVSRSAIEQSTLTTAQQGEQQTAFIAAEFSLWLAGEQVEAPIVGYWEEPASQFQHLKDVFAPQWVKDLWPVKYHRQEVKVTATYEVVYPHLKLPKILPEVKGVLVRVRGVGPGKEYQTLGVK